MPRGVRGRTGQRGPRRHSATRARPRGLDTTAKASVLFGARLAQCAGCESREGRPSIPEGRVCSRRAHTRSRQAVKQQHAPARAAQASAARAVPERRLLGQLRRRHTQRDVNRVSAEQASECGKVEGWWREQAEGARVPQKKYAPRPTDDERAAAASSPHAR